MGSSNLVLHTDRPTTISLLDQEEVVTSRSLRVQPTKRGVKLIGRPRCEEITYRYPHLSGRGTGKTQFIVNYCQTDDIIIVADTGRRFEMFRRVAEQHRYVPMVLTVPQVMGRRWAILRLEAINYVWIDDWSEVWSEVYDPIQVMDAVYRSTSAYVPKGYHLLG